MSEDEKNLTSIVLAPYILRARTLIRIARRNGGNQFRHSLSTMCILFDYGYFSEPVLLKAAILHDLIEEVPDTNAEELKSIDRDAPKVVELVLEVSKKYGETKECYLRRILDNGSRHAMLIKCADRINNLIDLHTDTDSEQKISHILDHTEQFVIPMAKKVDNNMVIELTDLVARRRNLIKFIVSNDPHRKDSSVI